MTADDGLRVEADQFAQSLADIVGAFTDREVRFTTTVVGERVTIRHGGDAEENLAIPLEVDGERLLSLRVSYACVWDSAKEYLSVDDSHIEVYPLDRVAKEPFFRYEYLRSPQSKIPCAHLQVHAHRDAFTHLLGYGGPYSKRARVREGRPIKRTPSVSEFHFPLGGPRFRPALEDILEVVADEFGLKPGPNWEEVRNKARMDWRRSQTASAVRDAPEEATRVLRSLGYVVTGGPGEERREKLLML